MLSFSTLWQRFILVPQLCHSSLSGLPDCWWVDCGIFTPALWRLLVRSLTAVCGFLLQRVRHQLLFFFFGQPVLVSFSRLFYWLRLMFLQWLWQLLTLFSALNIIALSSIERSTCWLIIFNHKRSPSQVKPKAQTKSRVLYHLHNLTENTWARSSAGRELYVTEPWFTSELNSGLRHLDGSHCADVREQASSVQYLHLYMGW